MKPQCEKILRFMELYGSITPNEAKDGCRCQRLAPQHYTAPVANQYDGFEEISEDDEDLTL